LALLAVGCQFTLIRGSGNLVEQSRELGEFNRIAVSHAFEVDVRIGEQPSVTVTADDNVIEHVTMTVSDGLLRLGLRPGFQVRQATLEATVTAPRLEEVRGSGAVDVRVNDTVVGERMRIHASGASDVTGRLEVSAVEVVASGASTVRLEGTADEADLEASGASQLELADLQTAQARARLSGASEGVVAVDDTLDVELSGASTLRYLGEPSITREALSGASSLERG
jgi:hypothetical protein